jgi:hypothetical protein
MRGHTSLRPTRLVLQDFTLVAIFTCDLIDMRHSVLVLVVKGLCKIKFFADLFCLFLGGRFKAMHIPISIVGCSGPCCITHYKHTTCIAAGSRGRREIFIMI